MHTVKKPKMIDPINVLFASNLRKLRMTSRVKQTVLAEALNLKNQQKYSDLENGKINFDASIIKKICSYFKINENEFKSLNSFINMDNNDEFERNFKGIDLNKGADYSLLLRITFLNYKRILIEDELKIVRLKIKVYDQRNFKKIPLEIFIL